MILIALSIMPVTECRGAIAYAAAAGIDPLTAFTLSSTANAAVAPAIYALLRFLESVILRVEPLAKLYVAYVERARSRVREYVEKYGPLGLYIFTAVPAPGTGAWTASIAAVALGISFRKGIVPIVLGVFTAAALVTLISYGIVTIVLGG